MKWDTGFGIANNISAIFTILYYVGFSLYMIYIVIDNSIYKNEEYFDKLAILIKPFKNKNIS